MVRNTPRIILIAALASATLAAAGVVLYLRQAALPTAQRPVDSPIVAPPPDQAKTPAKAPAIADQLPPEPLDQGSAAAPPQVKPVPQPLAKAPPPAPPEVRQDSQVADEFIPLPLARDALTMVGADPDADWVWYQAINDPGFSAHDRQDLIEDLNEEGFSDPKNITLDDLPLIVSRLQIIEELAPDAMDDVNQAAFAEAYKDLVNMYVRLTQP